MNKSLKKNILKISIGIGLIYWLIQSGKIDLKLLQEAFSSPIRVTFIILMMIVIQAIAAARWRLILEDKTQTRLPFLRILKANWIGMFFNTVLPGAVTGDLVKIFYVTDIDPKLTKKYLVATVFFDRVVGLFGLVIVGGILSIFNYEQLVSKSEDIKPLLFANYVLFGLVIIGVISLFILKDLPNKLAHRVQGVKVIGMIAVKLETIWDGLYSFRKRMIILIIFSIVVQTLAVSLFWFITHPFSTSEFTLNNAFSLVPIGFISIAIPIAPAGLGVGHAVFDKIFQIVDITNGANLFNIYFFYVIASGLTGILPYLLNKDKQIAIKEVTNLDSN